MRLLQVKIGGGFGAGSNHAHPVSFTSVDYVMLWFNFLRLPITVIFLRDFVRASRLFIRARCLLTFLDLVVYLLIVGASQTSSAQIYS